MCPWISHPLKITFFSPLSPQIQTACRRWVFWFSDCQSSSHTRISHSWPAVRHKPLRNTQGVAFPSCTLCWACRSASFNTGFILFLSFPALGLLFFFSQMGCLQAWKINTIVTMLNWKQRLQEEKEYLKNYFFQICFRSCEASIGQKRSGRQPDSKEALLLTGERG